MSINIISSTIDKLVLNISKPFTSHSLISELITNHPIEWEQLVNSYSGTRLKQEQKAVQQVARYLGNNANRLSIRQGQTVEDNTILGLVGHNPQKTTEWF